MADEPSETPAPLSDAEIAEIGERAAQATPGPWEADGFVGDSTYTRIYYAGRPNDHIIAHVHDDRGVFNAERDGPFIAAARTDIPRLLATLAARDAELAALREREAAEREIVAAVAAMHTNDMRRAVVGAPALITRARALLGTQTPATGATAGEEGEA